MFEFIWNEHDRGQENTHFWFAGHRDLQNDTCAAQIRRVWVCVCVDVTKAKGESQTGNQTGDSLTSEAS